MFNHFFFAQIWQVSQIPICMSDIFIHVYHFSSPGSEDPNNALILIKFGTQVYCTKLRVHFFQFLPTQSFFRDYIIATSQIPRF